MLREGFLPKHLNDALRQFTLQAVHQAAGNNVRTSVIDEWVMTRLQTFNTEGHYLRLIDDVAYPRPVGANLLSDVNLLKNRLACVRMHS